MPIAFATAVNRRKQKRAKFTPQKPQVGAPKLVDRSAAAAKPAPKPPAGFYDPTIDANERASGRGVGDLRIDTDTANQRASTGFITSRDRLNADASRSSGRVREDAGLATTELGRRFAQLAQSQAGSAVSAGVAGSGGGTFAAALAKRRENQGLAQAEIDRGRDRMLTDIELGRSRGVDDVGQDYQYGVDDRSLGLSRAEREDTLFGLDSAELRAFQARQAGYTPPKPKKPAAKPKLSAAQKKAVKRRTTPTSKARAKAKFVAQNKKKKGKK